MDAPLPTANEAMALLHDRFAGEYLARFSESRVTHKARQVLCACCPRVSWRELVAQTLHLSQRTLQRRLREEGTSFQTPCSTTPVAGSRAAAQRASMTLLEIAYLLGFLLTRATSFARFAAGSIARPASTGRVCWKPRRSVAPERRNTQNKDCNDLQPAQ